MKKLANICFVFLLGIAAIIILHQQSTIRHLQSLQVDNASPETGKGPEPALPTPAQAIRAIEKSSQPLSVVFTQTNPPSDNTQWTSHASNEIASLREDASKLKQQLQDKEFELSQIKSLIPSPEDPTNAYVGPGMWVNKDGQTLGVTQIEILGEFKGETPALSIKAWGRCHPTDCEWGEVPFYFLFYPPDRNPVTYHKGFAIWEQQGAIQFMVITFEKEGLKAEVIFLNKTKYRHARLVYNFIKIR